MLHLLICLQYVHSFAEPAAGSLQQVDFFGESLLGDLLDAPATDPSQSSAMSSKSADVDLFADADFVSAAPQAEARGSSQTQVGCSMTDSQCSKHLI